jgi:predicted site-specific integrase-resolvase
MTTIGYARVSTTDQDLDIQVAALKREGCTTIRSEKRSGTTAQGREELRAPVGRAIRAHVVRHPSEASISRGITGHAQAGRAAKPPCSGADSDMVFA